MCLRRRFKKGINTTVAAGSKELVLDLEEKCCIRQLSLHANMDDTTGTSESKWIIKIDEDEVLNETINNIHAFFCSYTVTNQASRPIQTLYYDDTGKQYRFIILDLGRVERRFAVFFENKDTSNPAGVKVGVIYDILED